jgi:hypothetical protein
MRLLREWMPVTFRTEDSPATVEWLPLGRISLADPPFDDAVRAYRAGNPAIRPVRTPWDVLEQVTRIRPGLRPHAGIFHVSRCGSTVLSNVLAALPRHLVIVEPTPLSAVLRPPMHERPAELRERWLDALIGALGYCRVGAEERYFLKFTSWNVLHVPVIRRVIPGFRWVFVYRHPVEVMVSMLRTPSQWLTLLMQDPAQAAARYGFSLQNDGVSQEECCARALADFYTVALASCDSNTLLINHSQLFGPFLPGLLDFLGIEASPEDMARMMAVSGIDSRHTESSRVFHDDRQEKWRAATPRVREAAERLVMDLYTRTDALRTAAPVSTATRGRPMGP